MKKLLLFLTAAVFLGMNTAIIMPIGLNAVSIAAESGAEDKLRIFALADSHVGWAANPAPTQQPSVAKQKQMMSTIMTNFPDIDAFFHLGDAFHVVDDQSNLWDTVDIFSNGTGNIPMFTIGGNHEYQSSFSRKWDPLGRTANMFNVAYEPFYSFNLKGIHFVMLPELSHVSFVNEETIEWLHMDLELNKDKTTIILSHNVIDETTSSGPNQDVAVYKRIMNSEQVYNLMKDYDIAAWIHGHIHTFEVVKKEDMLFVSAGRIGGVIDYGIQDLGTTYLGGFVLDITGSKISVRAYDAENNRYMDGLTGSPLNLSKMSGELELTTTLDPGAPNEYFFGGVERDGLKAPAYNYMYGKNAKTELFIKGTNLQTVNTCPNFEYFAQVSDGRADVPGTQIYSNNQPALGNLGPTGAEWTKYGIRLPSAAAGYNLIMPSPSGNGAMSAFRVSPGERLVYNLNGMAQAASGSIKVKYEVRDKFQNLVYSKELPQYVINKGEIKVEHLIEIPQNIANTIYENDKIDGYLNLRVVTDVLNTTPSNTVVLYSMYLNPYTAGENNTKDVAVKIDGEEYRVFGALSSGIYKFDIANLKGRSVLEFEAGGNKSFVYMIKVTDIDSYVKNAVVSDGGEGVLSVENMQNYYNPDGSIHFSSLTRGNPYYITKAVGIDSMDIRRIGSVGLELEIYRFIPGYDNRYVFIPSEYTVTGVDGGTLEAVSGGSVVKITALGKVTVSLAS